jgi:hypothetical protein
LAKIAAFIGMTVGGAIGWYVGNVVGFWTAFVLSCVGTGVGLWAARRYSQQYLVLVIGLCLAASSSVRAQAPTPSPGATKAAAELMQVIHADKQLHDQITAAFDVQLQNNPAMAPYRNALQSFADKYLTWATMGPQLTAAYAQTFTESELRDLIAFYKTPTGQRYASQQATLAGKSQAISFTILQQHQSELADLMRQQQSAQPADTTKH